MQAVSKSRVEGDDELSIQLDRGKIKYSVRGRHLNIEIDHGIGEISIFKGSVRKWYPQFSDEVIDDSERQKILDDVCEAMTLLGVGFVVE